MRMITKLSQKEIENPYNMSAKSQKYHTKMPQESNKNATEKILKNH